MSAFAEKYPHYHKNVEGLKTIDYYRLCELFEITDQAVGHALKKLLAAGQRGAKDQRKDIEEAIVSLQRKLEMMDEDRKIELLKEALVEPVPTL